MMIYDEVIPYLLIASQCAVMLGWLVPLVMGLRRRRRGADGAKMIRIAVVWAALALLLLGAICYLSKAGGSGILNGGMMLIVTAPLLLGWLTPLMAGLRRRRRAAGWILLCISVAWLGVAVPFSIELFGYIGRSILYRNVTVTEFDPARHPADQLGSIDVGWTGHCAIHFHIAAQGGAEPVMVRTKGGTAPAPAGSFYAYAWELYMSDATGGLWMAAIRPDEPSPLVVKAGESTPFPLGPALTSRVDVRYDGGTNVMFDLKLRDAVGNEVFLLREDGCELTNPQFEICAADGGVVWRDKFEYG